MIIPAGKSGKHIGVFGLARTGLVAVEALAAAGAVVYAWDDNAAKTQLVGDHACDLYGYDFQKLDALMIAPGVPLTHPEPHVLVKKAQAAGIPVIGDFDLFYSGINQLPARSMVAITGTNGKSTTTALITHMLTFAGREAVMGGNIGTGVLSLPVLAEGGVYVLEMSSYQIDLTHDFTPDVAVLLNISPDHLDRHGDMAGYVRAKARLFDLLSPDGLAIVGAADGYTADLADGMDRRIVTLVDKANGCQNSVYVSDNLLFAREKQSCTLMGAVKDCPTLRGPHNGQNMAAAYAVGIELGLDAQSILDSFQTFPGLEHRQELVNPNAASESATDILFINDSKATNQESAAKALSSFKNILWIAGGVSKNNDFQELAPWMNHVKKAFFIGQSAPMMQQQLGGECAGTLEAAFKAATKMAQKGDVVMLSPAASSFDQFTDFEQRGNQFKALVQAYNTSNPVEPADD